MRKHILPLGDKDPLEFLTEAFGSTDMPKIIIEASIWAPTNCAYVFVSPENFDKFMKAQEKLKEEASD
jgi:hypothetical protein